VRSRLSEPIDFEVIWSSLPEPAMILDKKNQFLALNSAAELFLFSSQTSLIGKPLKTFTGDSSRLIDVIEQSRKNGSWLAEYGVELSWRDRPTSMVDLQAAPIHERPGEMLLLIHPRSIAEKMDRTLVHRGAARSVIGMAAMLAHEIKNPLAGISGAAQLLEMSADENDRELTALIREEAAGQHPRHSGSGQTRRCGRLRQPCEIQGRIRPVASDDGRRRHAVDAGDSESAEECGGGRPESRRRDLDVDRLPDRRENIDRRGQAGKPASACHHHR
jgi:signal transduction histidine kinase